MVSICFNISPLHKKQRTSTHQSLSSSESTTHHAPFCTATLSESLRTSSPGTAPKDRPLPELGAALLRRFSVDLWGSERHVPRGGSESLRFVAGFVDLSVDSSNAFRIMPLT